MSSAMKEGKLTKEKHIRLVLSEDVNVIGDIVNSVELFPSDILPEMMSDFLKGTAKDVWFVYEESGKVCAFGFCEPERLAEGTWNLLAIGVDPISQGKGIGSKMMKFIEDYLREAGQRILIVETMGTPEYARTRQFYEKLGYTKEAQIREFYEPGADKVIYWKMLTPSA